MKLTGQAAIEAKREDSTVVLFATYNGKTFGNIDEKNAKEVMERSGSEAIWADVALPAGTTIEAYAPQKSHDQIVIERHQRKLAGSGIAIR